MKLTELQKKAVAHSGSPLLVSGVAGTGKTTVLARKIAYLIRERGIAPQHILALAYNPKTVEILQEKTQALLSQKTISAHFHTFNTYFISLFHHLNSHYPPFHGLSLIHLEDKKELVSALLKKWEINKPLSHTLEAIREFKRENMSLEKSTAHIDPNFLRMLREHDHFLKRTRCIEEEDIPHLLMNIFNKEPSLLKKVRNCFSAVIIDNFEECSRSERALYRRLFLGKTHFYAAGDCYQNISSSIETEELGIHRFINEFSNAERIQLDEQFNSTELISKTSQTLFSSRTPKITGKYNECLLYYLAFNEEDEAQFIADHIQNLQTMENISLHDMIIFYRYPSQGKYLLEGIRARGIPCSIMQKNQSLSHVALQKIFAYLRLCYNPKDDLAFLKICRIKGFSKKECEDYVINSDDPYLSDKVSTVRTHVEACCTAAMSHKKWNSDLGTKLAILFEKSGYKRLLESENMLCSLQELDDIEIGIAFCHVHKIKDFLSFLIKCHSERDIEGNDGVLLCPMSEGKGWSRKAVFITGFEDGIIPHYEAHSNHSVLEKERRNLYLAMTRSERFVCFTGAESRSLFGERWYNEVSPFLWHFPSYTVACLVCEMSEMLEQPVIKQLLKNGYPYQICLLYTSPSPRD